jgi:hypothetical protein
MIRLSVYTVTSVVFYIIGVVTNAHYMAKYYEEGIKVIAGGATFTVPLNGLSIVVIIMNVVLALRLYLHAWIIDESSDFRKNIKSRKKPKKAGEWLCRLLWIAGISWLPSAYAEFPKKFGPIKMHVHYYLFGILLFLFIWDCLTKPIIKAYSKENKEDLAQNWFRLDLLMLIIVFISSIIIEVSPNRETFNWLRIVTPLGYCVICGICLYQLGIWGTKVVNAAKKA